MFWWRRVPPSSPVAKHKVVIMANDRTKTEMEEALKVGFATNNIKKKRTRIVQKLVKPTDAQLAA